MIHIPVNLATEDELSEAVLARLLEFTARGYRVGTAFRRGGYGYLKRTIAGWNRAAASTPFLVLTDLDEAPCPSSLISNWLNEPMHPNLVLRIAVREVESWLLADAAGLAKYLGVSARSIPERPEEISNPKAALVEAARRSPSKEIKSRVVPKIASTAKQGPDYNSCLSEFVREVWDIETAGARAPSLRRAVMKYASFTPVWSS